MRLERQPAPDADALIDFRTPGRTLLQVDPRFRFGMRSCSSDEGFSNAVHSLSAHWFQR
jgi:hypothetical protein